MAFYKQPGFILHDSKGNLYNFVWHNENVLLTCFEKGIGKTDKKVLISNATIEFDVVINNVDQIFILWRCKDGSINLTSNEEGTWENRVVIKPNHHKILNLKIIALEKGIHAFYCLASNEDVNTYRICHNYYIRKMLKTSDVCEIRADQILNPLSILQDEKKIILGYYDLANGIEQIFIKYFFIDIYQWQDSMQLTTSVNKKLYIDMLITEPEELHITYSEYRDSNFVVKHGKCKLTNAGFLKLAEQDISNPGNCSYPTLILYDDSLWIAWTEYNYLASSYSKDLGNNWKKLYMWKDSRKTKFLRYKHISNESHSNNYLLNYVFARTDNLSFMGFGNLEDAVEIPIKKKEDISMKSFNENSNIENKDYNKDYPYNMEKLESDIDKIDEELRICNDNLESRTREIQELSIRIDNINKKLELIKAIEERTDNIEKHLSKKSRSFKKL